TSPAPSLALGSCVLPTADLWGTRCLRRALSARTAEPNLWHRALLRAGGRIGRVRQRMGGGGPSTSWGRKPENEEERPAAEGDDVSVSSPWGQRRPSRMSEVHPLGAGDERAGGELSAEVFRHGPRPPSSACTRAPSSPEEGHDGGACDESESEWAEPIADDAPRSLPFSLEVSAPRADSTARAPYTPAVRPAPRRSRATAELEERILGIAKAEGEEGAGGDATQKPKGCRGGTSERCL
ncbi:hypothetical protein THAOC_22710, partial [Thalassiosira oceanica]